MRLSEPRIRPLAPEALTQEQAEVLAPLGGGEWKMYTVPGRATIDIPAGEGSLGLHLGSAKQTVLLGAVFVLDFGPDYDLKKLAGG